MSERGEREKGGTVEEPDFGKTLLAYSTAYILLSVGLAAVNLMVDAKEFTMFPAWTYSTFVLSLGYLCWRLWIRITGRTRYKNSGYSYSDTFTVMFGALLMLFSGGCLLLSAGFGDATGQFSGMVWTAATIGGPFFVWGHYLVWSN